MKDFITRVAERALGTAPRIDLQSASRYAPSRLPLRESPFIEMTTTAAPDSAPITAPESYVDPPPRAQSSPRRPTLTTVTKATVASDPGYVAELKTDPSPEEPETEGGPIKSASKSITHRTSQAKPVALKTPLDSQTRSKVQVSRDAEPQARAPIRARPSSDDSPLAAAVEASIIRDDDRHLKSESGPFPIQEPNRRTENYISAPQQTAPPPAEGEPAAVVSRPLTNANPLINDRELEPRLAVAVDSIRSSTPTPSTVIVPDDRQPAMAFDQHETRGAISADFVRPATGRVDYSNYEREAQAGPSIRVTIGRVEVRSATPPTVVEPVAPPAPKLSLAEFLRQHNERRR